MVTIRLATQEDAGAIARVHVQSWRETYVGLVPDEYLLSLDITEREAQWRDRLTLDVEVFLAERNGLVVGFAGGGPLREPFGSYDAELYTIYILEAAQKQGTGRALLLELAAALRRKGFGSMLAWVLAGNASRHFYEKLGATELTAKEVTIGGRVLSVQAFGWADLSGLIT